MKSLSLTGLLCAALLLNAPILLADELDAVRDLAQRGQITAALEQVEGVLADQPDNAQARFLHGLLLVEAGLTDEAIGAFERLAADHPSLPEPYNNLAVLYAQQEDYDKARESLLTAINTHPSYATAHENLGDIYAKMASMAYQKALSVDGRNTAAQSKLAMISNLFTELPSAAAAPPAAVASAAAEPAPPVLTAAVQDAVLQTISRWADSWSAQDVDGYLSAYSRGFLQENGSAWEAQRRDRLRRPAFIQIELDNIRLQPIDTNRVRVRFEQGYRSNTYSDRVLKELVLEREGDAWRIRTESSLRTLG